MISRVDIPGRWLSRLPRGQVHFFVRSEGKEEPLSRRSDGVKRRSRGLINRDARRRNFRAVRSAGILYGQFVRAADKLSVNRLTTGNEKLGRLNFTLVARPPSILL